MKKFKKEWTLWCSYEQKNKSFKKIWIYNHPWIQLWKIMSQQALIIIDCINEMLHAEGKLSQKWYRNFLEQHQSITHINKAIADVRANNSLVVFVSLWFQEDYSDCPSQSPLFKNVPTFGILRKDTWSTSIYEGIDQWENDILIHKNRVNAFHHTELDGILKRHGVTEILLAGCATDLAINSTARDAHDRDYAVTIISSCCIAANDEDHDSSLRLLEKIAVIA